MVKIPLVISTELDFTRIVILLGKNTCEVPSVPGLRGEVGRYVRDKSSDNTSVCLRVRV